MTRKDTELADSAPEAELRKWERLDRRRRIPLKGRGSDSDEPEGPGEIPYLMEDSGHRFTAEGDFWKKSEYLKCKHGVAMISDDRGLPRGYQDKRPEHMRGPNRRR